MIKMFELTRLWIRTRNIVTIIVNVSIMEFYVGSPRNLLSSPSKNGITLLKNPTKNNILTRKIFLGHIIVETKITIIKR
jgi:hypothetical protein